jgi:ribonuclease HII
LSPNRPNLRLERTLHAGGVPAIAGLDEAGRGALAGPVVAAAVILPVAHLDLAEQLSDVRDSKLMTARQRELNLTRILDVSSAAATGSASPAEIDTLGLIPATRLAMLRALSRLECAPAHLILDYMILPECELPQTSIAHGDAKCLSISAASVLAKVTRDRVMCELDGRFPAYGFARHKGYGTRAHRSALAAHGPCEIHRRSYAPVAASLQASFVATPNSKSSGVGHVD